jgi:transcriptional regulator with XRE-family HTH domain
MQTLQDLGTAVAARRQTLGLQQRDVAARAGITQETLSRFERGRTAEFGARKLLAVLAVLDMELDYRLLGSAGSLDELRRERNQASVAYAAESTPRTPFARATKS